MCFLEQCFLSQKVFSSFLVLILREINTAVAIKKMNDHYIIHQHIENEIEFLKKVEFYD